MMKTLPFLGEFFGLKFYILPCSSAFLMVFVPFTDWFPKLYFKVILKHNRQTIKRENILEEIWGTNDYFTGRSMDVFMSRLRKYLVHDSRIKIESLRGIGFELCFPE